MSTSNGWHGDAARQGWFGNREYTEDPRTGQPAGPRGWSKKTSASKNFRKWAQGKSKTQIRRAKKKIKQYRKQHETERGRQKRLAHNRELRRTRPERMARNERNRRLDAELKRRRELERDYQGFREHKKPHIMPCRWCQKPFNLKTWKHEDGQPCPGPT